MANDVRLLETERDDVFQHLVKEGFDPTDFEWSELEVDERDRHVHMIFRVSVLKYKKNPEFYMIFGGLRSQYSPGSMQRTEAQENDGQWILKLNYVSYWLRSLRKQVQALNLWATLGQEKSLAIASQNLDNEPFEQDERQKIAATLDEIKDGIKAMHQFDVRQAAIIDGQFAYLHKGLSSWGRKDFANIFFAVVVNIGTALALENEAFRKMLGFALSNIQYVWTQATKLLN